MDKPTKEKIKEARAKAGLTQQQAADTIYLSSQQAWNRYESGQREMSVAYWDYFLLKTNQHPVYHLTKRRKKENENENKS